jgi:RNA polymerase sigma-70 factor (ECF subfamily)
MGMGVSEDDQATIGRILSGNIDAFGDIVAEYKGLVFHVVRSMIADNSEHEDLAQDILIRVYESLPRFQSRCGLATWISRIAYNTCLNRLRRTKSHPQDNLECRVKDDRMNDVDLSHDSGLNSLDSPTPHAVICRKELEATVRDSVKRLPMHYRLVVTLHYLEGFSIPDLAESLGIPKGTIKSHLFRSRVMLKSDLLQKFTIEDLL